VFLVNKVKNAEITRTAIPTKGKFSRIFNKPDMLSSESNILIRLKTVSVASETFFKVSRNYFAFSIPSLLISVVIVQEASIPLGTILTFSFPMIKILLSENSNYKL
jgi:hypothetical protein